jgi:hypothetical protein
MSFKSINILVAIVGTLILAITTLFEVNYLNYSFPIPYSKYNTITLADFKGYKKPSMTVEGMNEFAFINTSRVVKLLSDSSLFADTYFNPSRSYVFNQHLWNKDLLTHELYHFRIAEYHTRLIRKSISEYHGKMTSDVVKQKENEYHELERDMQMKYDDESDHSYVLSEQKKWQQFIDSSLLSLEQFENKYTKLKKSL